jgi:hypothetical protein
MSAAPFPRLVAIGMLLLYSEVARIPVALA